MKRPTIIAITLTLLITGCITGCTETQSAPAVPIILADTDNLKIIGENPVRVKRGENAVFSVEIPDGYTIESSDPEVSYNKQLGTITLSDVTYPTTVKVRVKKQKFINVSLKADGNGTITSDQTGRIEKGSEISLSAKTDNGYLFIGYSKDKPLRKGGKFLSPEPDFQYIAEETGAVYANFTKDNDTVILYNLNGGSVDGTDAALYYQVTEQTFHLCPNTLPDTGIFSREGYALAGYSTEPDGSGTFYAPGWNVIPEENKPLTLYAVWMEETPADQFTFSSAASQMIITGYTGGKSDRIVIPSSVGTLPVTAIAKGAFTDADCQEIYIPRSVTSIADGAFRNCSFSVCRFSDSVTDISDKAFDNCTNFSTLIIGAVRQPAYQATQHGTYSVKYERLMTASSPKMVITAGSSSAYGFLSEQFINELAAADHEGWDVVNYSCHYQTPGRFYIDVITNFLNEGDVLLHSPEPLPAQLGSNDITAVMWQFFEGAYEAFSLVDIREYEYVFSAFTEYNKTRLYMPDTSYEDHFEGVNIYGDCDFYKTGQYDGYIGGQGMFNFNTALINPERLNTVYDRAALKGASVWLTFAPVNENAVLTPSQKRSKQEEYMQFIRDNLHVTVISDVADQMWNGKYMYDTNLHLSTEGARLRTSMIAEDFIRALEADKS